MFTQHYLTFCVIFWGDFRLALLQFLSLSKWFFTQISISHDNISLQVVDKRRYGFCHRWTHPSSITIFVHLLISVIQKVIMTLNIMFNVLLALPYKPWTNVYLSLWDSTLLVCKILCNKKASMYLEAWVYKLKQDGVVRGFVHVMHHFF